VPSYYRDPEAPEPNIRRRVGVTAAITRGETVLVERRIGDPDVWAFIGGTLDESERVLATLDREVLEETGFEVTDARLLGVFSEPDRIVAYPDGTICRVLSIAFRVTVAGTAMPRLSSESAGMRLVERDELGELPFWPIHLPIREAFIAGARAPVVA
jgi:ADP-ribose pyrophosphatase YjhB (NUDIX family)